jgi:DNA-binding NarL/FixJ family response regulator
MAVQVLLFDDNVSMLDAFEILFSNTDNIVLQARFTDTRDLLPRIRQYRPDIILMDINIPPVDGIQATREIMAAFPESRVIIQTIFDEDEKVFAAICAGASGYILKQDAPDKIVSAVHESMQGGAPMSPGIANKVLQLFKANAMKQLVVAGKSNYQLSMREQEILKWLVEGLSYKMIADECSISYQTVKSHIKNIYHKLHVASMTEAVSKALRERLV